MGPISAPTSGRYHIARFDGKTGTFAMVYDLPGDSAFAGGETAAYSRVRIFGDDLYVTGFANDSSNVKDRGLILRVSNLLRP